MSGVLRAGRDLASAAGAVILLHGRGASADDILGLADEFDMAELAYLAPQAPGNTWYPYSFLAPRAQNEPSLSKALATVGQLVEQTGMPREKIVIAGFSQGACLATEFVVRHPARYGGLIAFTGGLIGPPEMKLDYAGDLGGTPAFLGAGDPDAHVPWQRVEQSAEVLTKLGAKVVIHRYAGMGHTINRDEIEEARKVLAGVRSGAGARTVR